MIELSGRLPLYNDITDIGSVVVLPVVLEATYSEGEATL